MRDAVDPPSKHTPLFSLSIASLSSRTKPHPESFKKCPPQCCSRGRLRFPVSRALTHARAGGASGGVKTGCTRLRAPPGSPFKPFPFKRGAIPSCSVLLSGNVAGLCPGTSTLARRPRQKRASAAPGAVCGHLNQIRGPPKTPLPSLTSSSSIRGDARCSTCWESKVSQQKLHFSSFCDEFVCLDSQISFLSSVLSNSLSSVVACLSV